MDLLFINVINSYNTEERIRINVNAISAYRKSFDDEKGRTIIFMNDTTHINTENTVEEIDEALFGRQYNQNVREV